MQEAAQRKKIRYSAIDAKSCKDVADAWTYGHADLRADKLFIGDQICGVESKKKEPFFSF